MLAEEVDAHYRNGDYSPWDVYNDDYRIKNILDSLFTGPWCHYRQDRFRMIFDEIMNRNDQYFILLDFDAYAKAQERVDQLYRDTKNWQRMALFNIANSGFFTSDRTIEQYATEIWKLPKVNK